MEKKILLIVESPTKANTIKKFLPSHYQVCASVGHIRDLPSSSAEIPASHKQKPWSRLGVNLDNNFEVLYVIPKDKQKYLKVLKTHLKDAQELYLATDKDREGESIAWHIQEVLKAKIPHYRLSFREITKKSIHTALQETRAIDMNLVHAQEARRILDRLYGYELSPLLWKAIEYRLSAGRVQSPGLRLIIERETARMLFKKSHFFSLDASFSLSDNKNTQYISKCIEYQSKKIITSQDFNPDTGTLFDKAKDKILLDSNNSSSICAQLEKEDFIIEKIQEKKMNINPPLPFTTSSLQQEASRKLKISTKQVMSLAQKLYEKGLITYMRTDSILLDSDAVKSMHEYIQDTWGKDYLATEFRQRKKNKLVQEAHEAIRPSGQKFIEPAHAPLTQALEKALYTLIFQRTLASQMKGAIKLFIHTFIRSHSSLFLSTQSFLYEEGFLKAYQETKDSIPSSHTQKQINLNHLDSHAHETMPPHRYTEASLVQRLEKEGIGRPSTYVSIISTLLNKEYITKTNQSLIPTLKGYIVNNFLCYSFPHLLDYQFTVRMETHLDYIAEGKEDYLSYLRHFYFSQDGLKDSIEKKKKEISESLFRSVHLPQLPSYIQLHIGKYGPYASIQKDKEFVKFNLPDVNLDELNEENLKKYWEKSSLQCGSFSINLHQNNQCMQAEISSDTHASKTVYFPIDLAYQNWSPKEWEYLYQLPQKIAQDKDKKDDIYLNLGPYGPYLSWNKKKYSIEWNILFTLTPEEAIGILEQKKINPNMVHHINPYSTQHPPLYIFKGPYGYYTQWENKNISLKRLMKTKSINEITEEECWEYIQEHIKKPPTHRRYYRKSTK